MRPLAIGIIALLAGCAAQTQTIAVKTPIAPAPTACRKPPPPLPNLPDRAMGTAEFAKSYSRLQAVYLRESGRYRLCQKFVSRLSN